MLSNYLHQINHAPGKKLGRTGDISSRFGHETISGSIWFPATRQAQGVIDPLKTDSHECLELGSYWFGSKVTTTMCHEEFKNSAEVGYS
jgi:hypothetical protein